MAVRGSPDPAQIRPKVSRDSVLREKPHPALCESESASLATDAARERFSGYPDDRLTCVTRANRETCGHANGEVGRPAPSSGHAWLCAGLPTPHKFDRRSPAIRYCARSLTRPSVNLRARLLPRTQHNRTLFRLPWRLACKTDPLRRRNRTRLVSGWPRGGAWR
jgi:hypothetical protein